MKLKSWMLAVTLAFAATARAATNDLTGLLQNGLFEEEANRDLNAAIANYQSLANAFDKDRQLAATAIFRLGECYRKLGKTNEAVVQYERIVKEFADQDTLVTLSRQNLSGLRPRSSSARETAASLEELRTVLRQAQAEVAKIEQAQTNRGHVTWVGGDQKLIALTQEQEILRKQLEDLRMKYSDEHPQVKLVQQKIRANENAIDARSQELVTAAQRSLELAQKAYDQKLVELNIASPSAFSSYDSEIAQAESDALLLQTQLKTIESLPHDKARIFVQQNFPNAILITLISELDLAQQNIIKLKDDYGTDYPKFKNAQEAVADLNSKIDAQVEGVVTGLRSKLAVAQAKLDLQRRRQSEMSGTTTGGGGSQDSATTDEEQQEIRRIQAMIQNSPDLINAPGWSGDANTSFTPLMAAATKGQLAVAKFLLDHGASVDATGGTHGPRVPTPLFTAADNGHKAMVELLLARGAEPNGAGGPNPLIQAISRGFPGVVDALLANKADPNAKTGDNGKRPLHAAASKGGTNFIQSLIAHGADVNARDSSSDTPLHLAVDQNQLPAVRLLLAAKADVNSTNWQRTTPLHVTADKGNAELVSLLLNSGAAVDATNDINATPLTLAVYRGSVDATRVLLEHKADPNHVGQIRESAGSSRPSDFIPIIRAIGRGNVEILKLLLAAGVNPDATIGNTSPLFVAIDRNNVDAVKQLLERGANPNRVENGLPALNRALENGIDKRIVSLLLDKGADPNARDKDGLMPIFRAQDAEVTRELIAHKADVNARLKRGDTPLMGVGYTSRLKVLLENGANPDLQETNGNTALHSAVYFSVTDAVTMLLAAKANPNIQNNLGYTPLDMAEAGKTGKNLSPWFVPYTLNNPPPPPGPQIEIAELLIKAGGLANLPKRDRIEVRRASSSVLTISKDQEGRNRYSLMEVIARTYRIVLQNPSGGWQREIGPWPSLFNGTPRFPDFKKIVIYRPTQNSTKQTTMKVDLDDILNSGDCSRDVWLEWGDVIEIPEADHPVDEAWKGLSNQATTSLIKCVSRQVTLTISGEPTTLKLAPELKETSEYVGDDKFRLIRASFMLRSVLDNSKLIRVSSDLAHVKVTRTDLQTKKKMEWVVDCTDKDHSDLWLRDGDVIEVPEKQ